MTLTATRRTQALESLDNLGLDGLLITASENRRYLSGFTGSSGWLFLSRARVALVTDGRYWAQAESQCPDVELVHFRSNEDLRLSRRLAAWLAEKGWSGTLGFEGEDLTVAAFRQAQEDLQEAQGPVKAMEPVSGLVELIRQIKSPDEIEAVRRAARVADEAWRAALPAFQEGVTEADFCAELEYRLARCGARKPSFDTIVASGPNGAYPHAGVTDRPIRPGELVTVDFGALVDGYCSDITRTIWLGHLDERSLEILEIVRRAHRAGMETIRPGLRGCEVDQVAREVIVRAGFGPAFSHSLGHGVGLAVHEGPGLRPESKTLLEAGMTVTVEPGIYVPGVGGCRVEDLVVLTETGAESLSRSPYQEPGQVHPLEAWT